MAATDRRAVLTGVGVLSPVGSDRASFWQSLLEGRSGIRAITALDTSALPVRIGGEIPDFSAKKYLLEKNQRKALGMMSRPIELGVAAAALALRDAGVGPGTLDPTRFGVEFGAGMLATELDDLVRAAKVSTAPDPGAVSLPVWGGEGMKEIPPKWMLKYLPNMPACHTSILFDAQGPNNTITSSEVASLLAFGEAYRIVGRGLADFMLVGGTESKMNPLSLVRHALFQKLSRRNDAPEKALRPFDRKRDGTVLGEAAAVFGLEELGHARRRGARVLAEVVGFASGFDRGRKGGVLARVIRRALADAGIGPGDVDHVNAHGSATVEGDAFEARAVAEVFGGVRPAVPVFAGKSYVGNTGAAAGVVELLASVQALAEGKLPGTLNHEDPDPACPVAVHTGAPRPVAKPYALKIGFTDLGQCAALVVRRWDGDS
ncbi:MAG TPA: beta-ketoacyl-[acyl-carrier-protein] synthase family protein [Gemmataceae bacterium]